MTLNEYIRALEKIRSTHGGELYLVDSYNEGIGSPEVSEGSPDDSEPPVVVVCERA